MYGSGVMLRLPSIRFLTGVWLTQKESWLKEVNRETSHQIFC